MYGAGRGAPPRRVRAARTSPGYEGSRPVRIGNAASEQFQLDVYGEVMDALHQAASGRHDRRRRLGWALQCALMDFLESAWTEPDEGIWEVRGPRRHFTHSKVMAWVAVDRAVQGRRALRLRRPGRPLARAARRDPRRGVRQGLRRRAQHVHAVLRVDATSTPRCCMIPLVGFLPADRPARAGHDRRGAARARHARRLRAALRRAAPSDVDGLPPGEGAFLACTFWLADNLVLAGRRRRGRGAVRAAAGAAQRRRPAQPRSTTPSAERLLGNFPQAFSHVSLVNTRAQPDGERHAPGRPAAARRGSVRPRELASDGPVIHEVNTWPWLHDR